LLTPKFVASMSEESSRSEFAGKVTQKAILFGPDGDVLVTKSEGKWQPPGGTFEYGETLVGGLRRELDEELDIDARVGPPVQTMYGGWIDEESYDPMVVLIYRCETGDRDITLNEEHDEYAWVSPEEASDRLEYARIRTALKRAEAIDDESPFEVVEDPYADTEVDTEEVIAELEEIRKTDPELLEDWN
jgi:8-oxo-dGTP pyrophosphatase MutT (NUDIX family)